MTQAAGTICALRLADCRPEALLPQTEATDTLLLSTVSVNDVTREFVRQEHDSYIRLRDEVPAQENRHGRSVIISLSAHNSYSPLRVTQQDLQALVVEEDIDQGFASIVASFGSLPRASEQGYSYVSTRTHDDGSYGISYLLRYAERDGKHWKIRQLGVYHHYRKTYDSHLWVLVHAHPPTVDTLSKWLLQHFSDQQNRTSFNQCPDLLHALILDTYIPGWRWYLESLGEEYTDLSCEIDTVELQHDDVCRATLANLQKCKRLLEKMAAMPAIMDALVRITSSMVGVQDQTKIAKMRAATSIHRQTLIDVKSSGDVLVRQTQGLVDLLGNTLDLKNQQDAALVNDHLLKLSLRTAKDSVVIRVITLVTLFYLPATFVATLFGMNFFSFEESSHNLIISLDIWIYFVVFAGLTGMTLLGWRLWTRVAAKDDSIRLIESNDEKV